MAKMTRNLLISLAMSTALVTAASGDTLPGDALKAEAKQDWVKAAEIYRQELERHPRNIILWKKLAEAESAQNHAEAAAEALCKTAEIQSTDANLHSECSKAWATANQAQKSFDAIERALKLSPDNIDFLISRAQLANWIGNYSQSEQDLKSVIKLAPEKQEDMLDDLARTCAWQGKLDEASHLLKTYLLSHSNDKNAYLDLIKFQLWRGNYPGAIEALDNYSEKIDQDNEERLWRARTLAWAGWWKTALEINQGLLEEFPDNYDINYSQVIGLRSSFLPFNTLPYQEKLQKLKPDSKETRDLLRATHLELASKLDFTVNHFEDSENIRIGRFNLKGLWVWNEGTRLTANVGRHRYLAPRYSLFDSIIDGEDVHEKRFQLGLHHAFADDLALEGQIGISELVLPKDNASVYSLALKGMPADSFRWRVAAERDRVDSSPRSVSLELTRQGFYGAATWSPSLRYSLDTMLRHDNYSDNNQRNEFMFSLNRKTLRTQYVNLDIGILAQSMKYDFYTNHGYYAPENYRRVALTGNSYFKFSDNTGLTISLALGAQKDERTNGWKSAHDISLDYVAGIFYDWQLRLNAGYSQRYQGVGAFDAKLIGVSLERRF